MLKSQQGYGVLIDKYLTGVVPQGEKEQMAFEFFDNTINSVLEKNQVSIFSEEQQKRIKGYAHQALSYGYGITQNSLQQSDYFQKEELALRKRAEAREIAKQEKKGPAGVSFIRAPIKTKPDPNYSKARNTFEKGKLKQDAPNGPYHGVPYVTGASREELIRAGKSLGMDFDTEASTVEIYQKLGMKLEEYALTEKVELVAYDEIENIGNFVNFYNYKNPNNPIKMPEGDKNRIGFSVSPIRNDGGTYMNIKQNGETYPIDFSYTKGYSAADQSIYNLTVSMIDDLVAKNEALGKVSGSTDQIVANNKLIEINLEALYDLFIENIKAVNTK